MSVYTVYEPPARAGGRPPDPERFVFVRDGFAFWAFVFGSLWLLWHRLWLALVLYLLAIVVLGAALWTVGAPLGVKVAVGFLASLLVGLEAGTLRRWTYERRGWRNIGLVVDGNVEAAERRFYDAWTGEHAQAASARPAAPPAVPPPMGSAPAVIGLFPEPGVHR